MMHIITTNPGLERFVEAEVLERCREQGIDPPRVDTHAYGLGGYVGLHFFADTSACLITDLLSACRSIHHIISPILHFQGTDSQTLLDELIAYLSESIDLPMVRHASSFRVSTIRQGDHPFTSLDVQRRVGAIYHERYGTPVNLSTPEIHLRVDVLDTTVFIGRKLTTTSLSYRHHKPFHPRVTLRTNIAYALLRCGRLQEGDRVLDPFCGSGTILIEGATIAPKTHFYGMDIQEEMVSGCQKNLEANGIAAELSCYDFLEASLPFSEHHFDAIITNPPYGLCLGQKKDFARFYDKLLKQAGQILKPGGVLVLLVIKRGTFFKIAAQHRPTFSISWRGVVEMGDSYPCMVVLHYHGTKT